MLRLREPDLAEPARGDPGGLLDKLRLREPDLRDPLRDRSEFADPLRERDLSEPASICRFGELERLSMSVGAAALSTLTLRDRDIGVGLLLRLLIDAGEPDTERRD